MRTEPVLTEVDKVPKKPEGVYSDGRGGWYIKITLGRGPLTGKREQITRRGFRSATDAGNARRELLANRDHGQLKAAPTGLTINGLLDLYLEGEDVGARLSAKIASISTRWPSSIRRHVSSRNCVG